MMCPSCNSEVADDAAVCPQCDAVLDPSLLDASPPEEDAPAPIRARVRPASKPVKKVAARPAAAAPKKRPAPAKPAPKRRPDDDDEPPPPSKKDDWRSQVSEEDWKANAGRAPEAFVVDRQLDPNDAMAATKRYLFELTMADKLALFGTATLLFSTFLPWKETVADGDVLGVFSSGIFVTLLSAMGVTGILVRTRKMSPTLNPLLPWIAQLGCTGFAGMWCLVYMKLAWDPTMAQSAIGNMQVRVSSPSFGLFLGVVAAITSIVGTIFGLKDVGR